MLCDWARKATLFSIIAAVFFITIVPMWNFQSAIISGRRSTSVSQSEGGETRNFHRRIFEHRDNNTRVFFFHTFAYITPVCTFPPQLFVASFFFFSNSFSLRFSQLLSETPKCRNGRNSVETRGWTHFRKHWHRLMATEGFIKLRLWSSLTFPWELH